MLFFFKKNRKKPNPIARSLKNRKYKQTIIKSKKIYSRKGKKMKLSKHAEIRSQQRGISKEVKDIIFSFGSRNPRPGNAEEYRITKKASRRLISEHKKIVKDMKNNMDALVFNAVPKKILNVLIAKEMEFIKYLDKAAGKAAILSRSDNNLITVYSLN